MITQKPKTVLKIDFAAFKPNKTALKSCSFARSIWTLKQKAFLQKK